MLAKCPRCGNTLAVQATEVERDAQCPKCNAVLVIPAESEIKSSSSDRAADRHNIHVAFPPELTTILAQLLEEQKRAAGTLREIRNAIAAAIIFGLILGILSLFL